MGGVVSDSSPILNLAIIGRLGLLRPLYQRVCIPGAVLRELVEEGTGRPGVPELQIGPGIGNLGSCVEGRPVGSEAVGAPAESVHPSLPAPSKAWITRSSARRPRCRAGPPPELAQPPVPRLFARPNAIWLVRFPFTDLVSTKLRPALVLAGHGDDVIVVGVFSRVPPVLRNTWLLIAETDADFGASGLRKASVVKAEKIATVHGSVCQRRLGRLTSDRLAAVDAALRTALRMG